MSYYRFCRSDRSIGLIRSITYLWLQSDIRNEKDIVAEFQSDRNVVFIRNNNERKNRIIIYSVCNSYLNDESCN